MTTWGGSPHLRVAAPTKPASGPRGAEVGRAVRAEGSRRSEPARSWVAAGPGLGTEGSLRLPPRLLSGPRCELSGAPRGVCSLPGPPSSHASDPGLLCPNPLSAPRLQRARPAPPRPLTELPHSPLSRPPAGVQHTCLPWMVLALGRRAWAQHGPWPRGSG